MTTTRRSGRLPAAQKTARREAILDAALTELIEGGEGALTMTGIARRAGASKETLYAWFGTREEVLRALIERTGDAAHAAVLQALAEGDTRGADEDSDDEHSEVEDSEGRPTHDRAPDAAQARETLRRYAVGLLTMLVGPASVAINRAAMSSPSLAQELLTSGRLRSGPSTEDYLRRLDAAGILHVPDAAATFCLFYGLVVQDTQIRVLLGDVPPTEAAIRARAAQAVESLFALAGS